jgi:hypothetical protein
MGRRIVTTTSNLRTEAVHHTIADWTIGDVIEIGAALKVSCGQCGRRGDRSHEDLVQRFGEARGATLEAIMQRARCAGCGSDQLRCWTA